jgi:cell division protein FtsL
MSMPQRQPQGLTEPIRTISGEAAGRKRPASRGNARERAATWLRLWAAALLVAGAWMALQTAIIATGTELVRQREVLARTERVGGELQLELASMRSVARIEAVARERLGFTRPQVDLPAAAAAPRSAVAADLPLRTVTLSLSERARGNREAGAGIRPRPMLGAWDTFLDWLAGRAAEAATRD